MASPRYTVIVPVLHFTLEEPVLVSLREVRPVGEELQILVAQGRHPARQRNAALLLAKGEVVVFLDGDCTLAADFWAVLGSAFARPGVDIVGGPAQLRSGAGARETMFHALLTHPMVVGPVSARYAPRGGFRATTQMELILCNLAARRSIFERIGPLSTELYPNEENEWLDRAQAAGVGIYYDPALRVSRPQRATWGALLKMLIRYGMGRTRQFRVSGGRFTVHQITPLILFVPLVAIALGWPFIIGFAALWLAASLLIALTSDPAVPGGWRLLLGLVGPFVPLTYAAGQILGWCAVLFTPPSAVEEIAVFDDQGARLG